MCVFFKRNCLGLQKFFLLTQSPLVFVARSCGGPSVGLGLFIPEIYPLDFYSPHVDVGPAGSSSVPLLPVWMDVVSLIS